MKPVDFESFVDELATLSGRAILPFFRTAMLPEDKSRGGVFDPVTEADRAGEAAMRRRIKQNFPAHGVVGEEFGIDNSEADYVWFLDPIDGTKSFIAGLPVWGTLIGLTRRKVPVYGLMHQPFTGERFSGDCEAARYRGPGGERPLRTRACSQLKNAVVATTSPLLMDDSHRERFTAVERETRLSRYGGDCYAYCMLAMGHLDLVIEAGLKSYDIAALIPIVEGAGGVVTTWSGESAANGGAIIAAGDRHLHELALKRLNG
jgi:histidinol phosphatase-like enzyme (inositol monophosphatase family)